MAALRLEAGAGADAKALRTRPVQSPEAVPHSSPSDVKKSTNG